MRWRRRFEVTLGLLLAVCVVFDIYTRWPVRFDVAPLRLDPATRHAVLLFHGRLGEQEPALLALDEKIRALAHGRPATATLLYVWAPFSVPRFRAQANGEHVGEALGAELAAMPQLESIHVISQSAGAFLADPLCEAYRESGGRARIVITYLDPMGFRGGFDPLWGARNYGACADYAEAFVNTDDRAMGTNTFLRHAWNVDVTSVAKPAAYADGGHRWPLRYYMEQLHAGDVSAATYAHGKRPRGDAIMGGDRGGP